MKEYDDGKCSTGRGRQGCLIFQPVVIWTSESIRSWGGEREICWTGMVDLRGIVVVNWTELSRSKYDTDSGHPLSPLSLTFETL